MKMLITLCSLVAAIVLGWRYNESEKAREAAEAQINAANAKLDELSIKPAPTPKPNWIEERNRNWASPLSKGASNNQRAVTPGSTIYYPVPASRNYFFDTRGRYWVDSYGTKHYTP